MKKVVFVIAVLAVIAVVWFQFLKPPAIEDRELSFALANGTVITGRLEEKVIPFREQDGTARDILVADVRCLVVGYAQTPEIVKRVNELVAALDSDQTRQDAQRELIALGPSVENIMKRHPAAEDSPRQDAFIQIFKIYNRWRRGRTLRELRAVMIGAQSRVEVSSGKMVRGKVDIKQFRIETPYGRFTVKLEDVRAIFPADHEVPGQSGRWAVELRDKTHIRGTVLNKSFRVKTPYATMLVPVSCAQELVCDVDRKTLRVRCFGSDRIIGAFEPETLISLKTDKGVLDLSAEEIATAAYGPITLRVTSGKTGEMSALAFSPDGKRLVAGGFRGFIGFWDVATGKNDLLLNEAHFNYVEYVAFSPDGRFLAAGGRCTDSAIWDTVTGEQLFKLKVGGVSSMAFSPDGKRLVVASSSKTITFWDPVTGKKLQTFRTAGVRSIAFSPDGKRLALGSDDKTIKIWDSATGNELFAIKGHSVAVRTIAFSPDGKRLASGSDDNTIKLWDSVTGKGLFTLNENLPGVTSIAFSSDGKLLAAGLGDKTIQFWDTVTGEKLSTLRGHSGYVTRVAFSPDGKHMASVSYDYGPKRRGLIDTVKIWDAQDWAKAPTKFRGHLTKLFAF